MLIYQDIFTGDEVISDSFKLDFELDDVIMKTQSAYTSKENAGGVDIGKLNILID